jgi:flavin-dependent dehydrogenase
MVDKAGFPRHKLCGEFVSPECLDHLRDLGVMPDVEQFSPQRIDKTVFYGSGGRSFSVASRWLAKNGNDSIGLSRQSLDQLLLDRASASGVTILTETSVTDTVLDTQIELTLRDGVGSSRSVTSSLLIDATGRGRYIARKFDKPTRTTRPSQVAFKAHLREAAIETGSCEIYSYPGGYGGCAQVENGLFNVCFVVNSELVRSIGSDPMRILEGSVLSNERAAKTLSKIKVEGDWISVPIARYGSLDPAPAPGVLAIGDAAAFIDPFTGSGIAMALESSRLVCKAIVENDEPERITDDYRRLHAVTFSKRLRFCRNLRFLSGSPRMANAIIRMLGTSEPLNRVFARLTRSGHVTKSALIDG